MSRAPAQDVRRALPKVDVVLAEPTLSKLIESAGRRRVVEWVREELHAARRELSPQVEEGGGAGVVPPSEGGGPLPDAGMIAVRVAARARREERRRLIPVLNATGVVLHTNLGRAPLSASARAAVEGVARGYSNLEYDLPKGARGSRHVHGADLLCRVTGAEAAMVVNNNAAAVLLALAALPERGEVVISRGELIEIGGAFRIPDVLEQSGCRLREVGTTNRTYLRDYEAAITEETVALFKVHTSNYRVSGFTHAVPGRELAALARAHGLSCVEDLGSGVLLPAESVGLPAEPTVQDAVASGMDLVTFSGDKLLGGPQAGLIAGRAPWVERCKRHPLARALRPGKLTLAALQATLTAYDREVADAEIPLWRMLSLTPECIGERALRIADGLRRQGSELEMRVRDGWSAPGGGSLPEERLPTRLLAVRSRFGTERLAARLRGGEPPVVGRIEDDWLVLDLRTIDPEADGALLGALLQAGGSV